MMSNQLLKCGSDYRPGLELHFKGFLRRLAKFAKNRLHCLENLCNRIFATMVLGQSHPTETSENVRVRRDPQVEFTNEARIWNPDKNDPPSSPCMCHQHLLAPASSATSCDGKELWEKEEPLMLLHQSWPKGTETGSRSGSYLLPTEIWPQVPWNQKSRQKTMLALCRASSWNRSLMSGKMCQCVAVWRVLKLKLRKTLYASNGHWWCCFKISVANHPGFRNPICNRMHIAISPRRDS